MPDLFSDICQLCHSPEGFGPISYYGDFTQCFIDGVLLNLSSLFMIIFGISEISRYLKNDHPGVKYRNNWLIISRLGLVLINIVIVSLASLSIPHNKTRDITVISQYTLSLLSLFVALGLHWVEYHRSKVANGVVLFYWLFETFGNLAKTVNFLIRYTYEDSFYFGRNVFIFTIFQTIISLSLLLLEAIPKKPLMPYQIIQDHLSKRKENPYDSANIFSRISFSWMTELMRTGYEKYLSESDLYKLPESFSSDRLAKAFNVHWENQVKHKSNPSLAWAMWSTFSSKLVLAAFLKAIHDVLAFTQPQLLRILIKFVNDYTESRGGVKLPFLGSTGEGDTPHELPIIRGFMIAVAMFLVSFIQTSVLHQYFLNSFNTGMNIRSAMTSVLYQKALVLSNEASDLSSTGDVVNLMSVDVQRLQDLTQWCNIIWSGPFQIILCLFSLYKLLGHSMWVGVIVLIVMIPLNSYLMRIQKQLQKVQMKYKDERTRVINEILNNIKSLKLYAWEQPYKEKLEHVRNEKELKNLTRIGVFNAMTNFQFNLVPFLVSCSTFAVFVYIEDKPLTTDLVFPALTLFNLLTFPLAALPIVITAFIEASVSMSRLFSFMTNEELQTDAIQRLPPVKKQGDIAVNIGDNATFLWKRKPEYKVALKNIEFQAKKGELACIVGKVGSGKSAFIQSILGDLFRVKGFATIHGNVAYVSQLPWIMNGTVKDNILFGHKYNQEFYEKTLRACALTIDLSILPDGDQTLVGEKGISLSGGQKARLSLARAVYARADVYLLDDPLAAVDEHVSKHLIQHVIGPNGLLHTKTRVLATNKISVLSIADNITLLDDGEIVQQGTYNEVTDNINSPLCKLISEYGNKNNVNSSTDTESTMTPKESSTSLNRENTVPVETELKELDKLNDLKFLDDETGSLRRGSMSTLGSIDFNDDQDNDRREHREQGKVKWSIYKEYAKACNPRSVVMFLSFIVLSMFLSVMGNFWLKHWSEVNTKYGKNPNSTHYLLIYFGFGVTSAFATLCQTVVLWVFCTIHGSKYLHSSMVSSILRAPMTFFETTPIGRILNRFSNDVYKIDEVLGRSFSQFFVNAVKVSFTILVICWNTWQFILLVIPMGVLYLYYQQYYLRTSRELRRLDSITKSPIYAHFQESLGGLATIRGYEQQKRFIHINQARVDNNMSAYYPSINSNRWLAYRLEFLGSLIIFGAASLSILKLRDGTLTAGMIGLSLSYALQVTQSLNWIVRMTVEVETNIVSVERIKEYAELKSEAPLIIEEKRPSENWPERGAIKFENYSTRYRPDLDLVLKNISLDIKPQEKVGIVGRTGAGKSSLTLALFRIIEAAEGSIIVDGLNISEIGLYDLRHKLSIIPQDSQVFEGTIRENIDPTNIYTDEQIWNALELSHLKQHILRMNEESVNGSENNALYTRVTEGGNNLSVGQRQLMCLARALLVPSKILILDEATAAVDVETDSLIQETIRTAFKDRTILTIAHRLNTIMDSDKIVVLDKGEVAEFDTPQNLLKNTESLFYSLCEQSGLNGAK
ncbi:hypothetical protein Kpol_1033p28 [Vanderwaltozyma polyspora DSM 70294]|uniref:Metal resistance protein YCF1 n=1 Tax=Vanderwaltozyma polyspora (strain ATCC 22028 / DSM 70294 / BCRC 21397 / CBS 2163 / NBRC 10782 / NRRL Y-8283 / UCD 57-17) TaxID=436907 RepID=A7TJ24_VANPO|nr:uncharacterized protein Kpol_1033p28 [Vanderwaltozyma polyspora DSM 70294]EDO17723.1 hypothetical protein Kpol_1033p28 [Vanderwaltozyma polyspora DSM 70294]